MLWVLSLQLYYRSIEISPKPYIIVDCDTLEETKEEEKENVDDTFFIVEQNPNVKSSSSRDDHSRTASESKDEDVRFESKEDDGGGGEPNSEPTGDKIQLPSNRSPIITDGRYIYLISQWTVEIVIEGARAQSEDREAGEDQEGNGDDDEDEEEDEDEDDGHRSKEISLCDHDDYLFCILNSSSSNYRSLR